MALPNIFANVSELDTPQLDQNFNALGALTVIPCTATGTTTFALTPVANCPSVTSYTNSAPVFGFVAPATSVGAQQINVSGVGAKNAYKNNGATITAANDFLSGSMYYVAYNSALNAGVGGFVIVNQSSGGAAAGSVQGRYKNLVVTNTVTGTPNTLCRVTADSVAVSNGSTTFQTLLSVNVTVNSAASGANGLDTGSLLSSTWYAIYVIYNPSTLTTASLMSASFTSPTMPSGYTMWARVGAMLTDGSSNFMRVLQKGNEAQYVLIAATNTIIPPTIASGVVGTYSTTSPSLSSASLSAFVPPTASRVNVLATNVWKGGAASNMLVAPSLAWGGTNQGPTGSAGSIWPISFGASAATAFASILLDSISLAWCSSAAGGAMACLGWTDNL